MAAALRLAVEKPFGSWTSPAQRGFVRGRSMFENVMDIDFAMRLASMKGGRPLAVFFDFEAAFPSISWDFVFRILVVVEAPQAFVRALRRLYNHNVQTVKLRSSARYSFVATCGVRQGCPLSPLVFAVCVDILLRRLVDQYVTSKLRAFADDIGMILPNWRLLPEIFIAFREFAKFSGLALNLPKTVAVPLWTMSLRDFKQMIIDDFPALSSLTLDTAAKYLGFWLGPSADERMWKTVLTTYAD